MRSESELIADITEARAELHRLRSELLQAGVEFQRTNLRINKLKWAIFQVRQRALKSDRELSFVRKSSEIKEKT